MWVTAATFSIRKTRYCRNAEYRKIMQEKDMGGGPVRRPGRSVAFAARCHDSSRLHCGTQKLQGPSAAHKKYAC